MISWGSILYGAGLSVVLASMALVLAGRERSLRALIPALIATFAGPVAWNAILRVTHAREFFTDAPIVVFPASWQDTGSGVFAFAFATVALTLARPDTKSSRIVFLGGICGIISFLVDIYLY